MKEGRRRKKSQREEHRGQEKLQDSVTDTDLFQPYPECILHIKIHPGNQPVDLTALVPLALNSPVPCHCSNHQCGQFLLQCRLEIALGRLFILNLARLGDNGAVIIPLDAW